MATTLDIPRYAAAIDQLNAWLCTYPLTDEFRERTTYRQFHDLMKAKQQELGLTKDVWKELSDIEGNDELDSSWLEYSMTLDNRELLCPAYFLDLPLNYYWMEKYEPLIKAVDDYIDAQPSGATISDDTLLDVVRQHLKTHPTN